MAVTKKLYQLDKACVSATGQVKWDLVLTGNKVTDLQLTPIHPHLISRYRSDVMNYTHAENLRMLYSSTRDTFFNPYTPISSSYPVGDAGEMFWEDSYLCRMYRTRYGTYHKEFAFLLPIYITYDSIDDIQFRIKALNERDEELCDNVIDMAYVRDYINQYIKESHIEDEEMIYINLEDDSAYIKGIDVATGLYAKKDISGIVPGFKSMERPVMETDDVICRTFCNNHMIIPNMINLNFCFNMEDILPKALYQYMTGKKVNIMVDAYIRDGKGFSEAPYKEIYSNYDFMPVFNVKTGAYDKNYNAFSYLNDNKCIDIISRNRIVQNVFHWSLRENPEYMFNLYDGTAPIYVTSDGGQYRGKGLHVKQPLIWDNIYSPQNNPIYWASVSFYNNIETNAEAFGSFSEAFSDLSRFSVFDRGESDCFWWGMMKIDRDKVNQILEDNDADPSQEMKLYVQFLVIIGKIDIEGLCKMINENRTSAVLDKDKRAIFVHSGDKCMFILSNNIDYGIDGPSKAFYYRDFLIRNVMCSTYNDKGPYGIERGGLFTTFPDVNPGTDVAFHPFNIIKYILSSVIDPQIIIFDHTIEQTRADSPDLLSNEISYVKTTSNDAFVIRYGGNIIPYFIDPDTDVQYNNLYCNKIDEKYIKYIRSRFDPLYPSIGYFPIKKMSFDDIKGARSDSEIYFKRQNLCRVLPHELTAQIQASEISKDDIRGLFAQVMGIEQSDRGFDDVFNHYSIEYSFEYASLDNINEYIYRIKYTLK